MTSRLTRRDLLKRGPGAVAAPYAFAGPMRFGKQQAKGQLSIIQWIHFVPAYDEWFDKTWVKQWGEKNDVQVKVDHINNTQLDATAAAQVAAQKGARPLRQPAPVGGLRGPGHRPHARDPGA